MTKSYRRAAVLFAVLSILGCGKAPSERAGDSRSAEENMAADRGGSSADPPNIAAGIPRQIDDNAVAPHDSIVSGVPDSVMPEHAAEMEIAPDTVVRLPATSSVEPAIADVPTRIKSDHVMRKELPRAMAVEAQPLHIEPEAAPPVARMIEQPIAPAFAPPVARAMAVPEAFAMEEAPVTEESAAGDAAASAPADEHEHSMQRDDGPFQSVTVFFGTDRARAYDDSVGLGWQVAHYAIPGFLLIAGVIGAVVINARGQRPAAMVLLTVALVGTLAAVKFVPLNVPMRLLVKDKGIPVYGSERGEMVVGTCEVSIPKAHKAGELEAPSILRLEINEDQRKHVVLTDVQPLHDAEFYEDLRETVHRSPHRDLFVFIHGYNVTFENAARRTAQMAYDLHYDGAPVFYSWPSQGSLAGYTVDENNVTWTVPHLKQFLLDIAQHSDAESISLIAHSMGNRALTQALRELTWELKGDPMLFSQVILAAPDIDAEVFKRDIAPAIRKTARQVTLYASSNDNALIASKKVHGYPRAGESGDSLLVLPGIETIDVSDVDTSLLGHSYYGSSESILTDIKQLIHGTAPAVRDWLRKMERDGLPYWVYDTTRRVLASQPDAAIER